MKKNKNKPSKSDKTDAQTESAYNTKEGSESRIANRDEPSVKKLLTSQSKRVILEQKEKWFEVTMSTSQQKELIRLLRAERDGLLSKVNSLTESIKILEQSVPSAVSDEKHVLDKDDGYDKNMSLKSKVMFFLRNEQRFLHNRELAELAHEREPGTDVKTFIRKFSSLLSAFKREGKLVKVVVDNQNTNTFWGSPKWLDQDGNVIPQYKYNSKYVTAKKDADQFEL